MKLVAIVALVVTATPAWADPPVPDPNRKAAATQLVADGSARYDAKDYQGALDRYDRAYAIYPAAKLHYNRALVLEALHRPAEAADEYDRFLVEASDVPPAARAHAREALVGLEKALGKLALTANVAGAVTIDGLAAGDSPVTVHLTPGPHAVRMTAADRKPWHETLTIMAGVVTRKDAQLAPLELQLSRHPPAPFAEPGPVALDRDRARHEQPRRSMLGRWWFWSALGAGVAAGVAITYVATRPPGAPTTELGTIRPDL